MPFDAAGFPKKDGAYPTEPTPVERWLRYVVAVLFILVALVVPVGRGVEFMGMTPSPVPMWAAYMPSTGPVRRL